MESPLDFPAIETAHAAGRSLTKCWLEYRADNPGNYSYGVFAAKRRDGSRGVSPRAKGRSTDLPNWADREGRQSLLPFPMVFSKEEAVAYAEKNGLSYRSEEPKPVQRKIQNYSDNFKSTRLDQTL
jgi:hypothetical protein